MNVPATPRYQAYTRAHLDRIPQLQALSDEQRVALKAVSAVLPFKANSYVVEQLIDWNRIPDDPMFQLTFPQRGMLSDEDFHRMADIVRRGDDRAERNAAAEDIRKKLNPHPAGQMSYNVPHLDGEPLPGVQHKYRETVLFFPSQGQTCHAYCTYCFRWAQFIGDQELKFANKEGASLVRYLEQHPEVTDVLFTGGDPMIMRTKILRRYIEALLEVDTLQTIRIGTKSLAWWPYRYLTDPDSDDLMRLFEEVVARGKHLAIMGHYSHPRELSTDAAQQAVRRIISTGAMVRCQAPLIRHVNDDAHAWTEMWDRQVKLGAIPYYMFVERDTGPKHYFEVPLARAYRIFNQAYRRVSGLGRTVRGPSMSCTPGKVLIDGITRVGGEDVFVLKFIQGRDPEWAGQVFFARYDEQAGWLGDLEPAFGKAEFFFEPVLRALKGGKHANLWSGRSGGGGDTPRTSAGAVGDTLVHSA